VTAQPEAAAASAVEAQREPRSPRRHSQTHRPRGRDVHASDGGVCRSDDARRSRRGAV